MRTATALIVWLALMACGAPPAPLPGLVLTQPELKLRLIDRFGVPAYCDPWLYPVGRIPSKADMDAELARLDPAEVDAIVKHDHLNPADPAQEQQLLRRAHQLAAIQLTDAGPGRYRFDYSSTTQSAAGTITSSGTINLEHQGPPRQPTCPICLAETTRIATPAGEVLVTALRRGDEVWTQDARGARVAAKLEAVASTPAPFGHQVVVLRLADGRSVTVSPGHPLADGRLVGSLKPGDLVDGSRVVTAMTQPYTGARTWDLLPAGGTGVYWADGIPLRSTIG